MPSAVNFSLDQSPVRPAHRVIVVDDNRDSADSLALLVKAFGHEVKRFYGGREAVEALEPFRPTFLVSDISMPQMTGIELIQTVRLRPGFSGLYAVAVSGVDFRKNNRHLVEAGFNEFLMKPVNIARLEHLLQRITPVCASDAIL